MAGVLSYDNPTLTELGEEYELRLNRNLFCYGLMKTLPYFSSLSYIQAAHTTISTFIPTAAETSQSFQIPRIHR